MIVASVIVASVIVAGSIVAVGAATRQPGEDGAVIVR
jgi:hypothetical protein